MKITTKGQVTIPVEIRDRLGLLPDTEVRFSVRGKVAILEKVSGRTPRGTDVIERLRGRGTVKMTTDEILALTRGR
ncbi:MAG: AbrB/MazE/SpoVT family DNA-binding domain-containing protein [Gemmatimonadota bacterium]|nr:AbrB/MazE/SpoVT family DNA-binding domain-containing protein [Gemmatimonadota bacterium]